MNETTFLYRNLYRLGEITVGGRIEISVPILVSDSEWMVTVSIRFGSKILVEREVFGIDSIQAISNSFIWLKENASMIESHSWMPDDNEPELGLHRMLPIGLRKSVEKEIDEAVDKIICEENEGRRHFSV